METCYELPVTEWRYEEESDSNHAPSSQPIFSRSNNWERQHPSEEKNIYLVSTLVYKETITTHSPLSNIPDIDNGWRLQFVWILHGPIQFPHGWADFFPKNLSTPRTHDSEEKRIGATSWCCYFLNVGTNPYPPPIPVRNDVPDHPILSLVRPADAHPARSGIWLVLISPFHSTSCWLK